MNADMTLTHRKTRCLTLPLNTSYRFAHFTYVCAGIMGSCEVILAVLAHTGIYIGIIRWARRTLYTIARLNY